MPHLSGDKFAKTAEKRQASLPRSGDFHVAQAHHTSSPQTKAHEEIQEKITQQAAHSHQKSVYEPREQVHGYDVSHRNGYRSEPDLVEPHIDLHHYEKLPTPHESTIHTHEMTRSEKINFVLMRTLGNFLLFFSLYGVGATFGPALYFEGEYRIAQARGVEYTVQNPVGVTASGSAVPSQPVPTIEPVSPGFGSVLAGANDQVLIPPDTEFSVVIPKIGATSKVHPNVDPLSESDFLPKLQTGVAHAKGTVFPGMEGNTYLFAHSTDNFWNVGRYNAVFYLLKELQPGDDVIVFFEGKRHNYKVERTEIRDASDVEFLVESQQPGKEQLIMQTCWPPGTTWKRMFVIATPR